MQHQITTTDVLHDEVDTGFGLETGVQVEKEGMTFLVCNQEHTLFGLGALYFIILDDEFLLQNLDGIQLAGALGFSQHDLSEVTLSENSKEVEVIQSNASLGLW